MSVADFFGENVFNLSVMKKRLPKETFKSVETTIKEGTALDAGVAEIVANAMKDWAIEKGATHFTHWFQPMTGVTAEKHDSFISPTGDGNVILEFSGKNLVRGEPDASSFPSGGLRATFEARGYTAWDPTSYAFIKDGSLCIPTAFYSYTGEALDKKTPLLRSMEAINKQALRVLKYFDSDATRVVSYVGPEQEYFIVDEKLYEQRKDLMLTGRTLFGAPPAKGQEMEDHYFGQIKDRISAYMKDLDEELWKLGVCATTKHNEVAPAQHELAPIFATANVASDHNQLTMEAMKKIAKKHGLVCLLHEKPYDGVNGSGKHNNWSIGTNTGENLFKPGKKPIENKKFLLFLAAVIKAVDEYSTMLRVAVATAGNDHRLGANEAPPAIVSIFLGKQLEDVVEALKTGKESVEATLSKISAGVEAVPLINKDSTDRNRTSPFAFTGNRFEFRMPGSAQSIAGVNTAINTAVAASLSDIADELDAGRDVMDIVVDILKKHDRVLFNGNGYSDEWVAEAERRGLPNLKSTVEAVPELLNEKNVKAYESMNVLSRVEIESRYEILLEEYSKIINIEMLTSLEMAKQEILPACIKYVNSLAKGIKTKESIGISVPEEKKSAAEMAKLTEQLTKDIAELEKVKNKIPHDADVLELAKYYEDPVLKKMGELRKTADTLETVVSKEFWPFPTYEDLMYRV
ncbi:MAG: glutamine synthetase III [Clostridia bacterium]|nr:glutamine synthetase III [Clostridia bacterium]